MFLNTLAQGNIFGALTYFIAVEVDVWVALAGFAYLFFGSHQNALFSIDRIRNRFFEAMRAAVSVCMVWMVSGVIKLLTHAARPYVTHSAIKPLFTLSPQASFPSGHATLFFALAYAIYRYHKNAGRLFFALAVLISITRVAAGVHYAGDVIFGAILGIFGTYLVERAFDYIQNNINFPSKRGIF